MQGSGFLVYLNCCATFGRMNLERLGNLVRLREIEKYYCVVAKFYKYYILEF